MPLYANCPFCLAPFETYGETPHGFGIRAACPICGEYTFADSPRILGFSDREQFAPDCLPRTVLSHRVRQMTLHREWPRVTDDIVQRAIDDPTLPSVAEQLENLVLYLGEAQEDTGLGIRHSVEEWQAIIGARSGYGVRFVIAAAEEGELAERIDKSDTTHPQVRLTFEGWQRFEDLQRALVASRRSFMAMPFRDKLLDRVFAECFLPAVAQTGFELFRVDQDPKAGLIDDRIRVAIQTSRFVIADLTNSNPGAYWEAGFGEGLRRPVIYTCERSYFEANRGTHFDTRNRQTIVWAEDELDIAGRDLKSSIRATLPEEAILEDPIE